MVSLSGEVWDHCLYLFHNSFQLHPQFSHRFCRSRHCSFIIAHRTVQSVVLCCLQFNFMIKFQKFQDKSRAILAPFVWLSSHPSTKEKGLRSGDNIHSKKIHVSPDKSLAPVLLLNALKKHWLISFCGVFHGSRTRSKHNTDLLSP